MGTEGSASENQWYWAKQGSDERNGPVSRERLEEVAEAGDLKPEDLVWTKGMGDWKEAGSVEKLKGLFETPPPLSDSDEGEKTAADDGPPVLSQNGDGKEEVEETRKADFNFPVEFDVKWKGTVASNESTLVLRKKEISLHLNDWTNHGGEIQYKDLKIDRVSGNDVEVTAPFGFDNYNSFDRTTTLTFRSERLAKKAVEIIKITKGEEIDVGNRLNIESTDDNEKVTATEEGEDPFWKRHPVWTGVIAVFVLGALANAFDESETGDGSNTDASEDAAADDAYECARVEGRYVGLYENTGTGKTGKTTIIIEDGCEYDAYIDGKKYGSGTAEYDGESITLGGDLTVQHSGGVIRGRTNTVTGEIVFALEEM